MILKDELQHSKSYSIHISLVSSLKRQGKWSRRKNSLHKVQGKRGRVSRICQKL